MIIIRFVMLNVNAHSKLAIVYCQQHPIQIEPKPPIFIIVDNPYSYRW